MTLIKRTLSILLIAASLCGGSAASAADVMPSPHEAALLSLINQARQNPLAVAASMGLDPQKVIRDLPELEQILREGLPALTFSPTLAGSARAHTQDMFANGYYSYVSPDGRGYDARIRNSGYPAVTTGESLGMLFFANFINPGDAVRFIFEYMFWDELDPNRTEKRNILDPGLKEAGISVDTGALSLGGGLWNVYLATVDFGAAIISGPEGELLRLINQARANPVGVAESLGINIAAYLAWHPELRAVFAQGLPPLAIHAALVSAAKAHVSDMMDKNYYNKVSPDGRTVEERIAEQGYRFMLAGESLGKTWFTDPANPMLDAARRIFQGMLMSELSLYNAGGLTILNPAMSEVGISLQKGLFRSGPWAWDVYLAACDVALPSPVDTGVPGTMTE